MKKVILSSILMLPMFLLVFISCNNDEDNDNNNVNEFTPQAITPDLIAQGELHGNGQESITKQNLVIKTPGEWDNLIAAMNSVNNTSNNFTETNIDFSKYQVIAVFDEVKNRGGWSIDITDITKYPDSIIVTVQNLNTGNVSRVFTQPYHIVKIPASEKKTVFQQEENNEKICYCIVDTLKGEWSWFRMSGGIVGGYRPNNFESIIRILSQNEDESVNYQVFVADTLFYKGSFQIKEGPWSYKKFNIKLPHINISPITGEQDDWFFHFFNEEVIYFWDGIMDGFSYHYKKIGEE